METRDKTVEEGRLSGYVLRDHQADSNTPAVSYGTEEEILEKTDAGGTIVVGRRNNH